MNSKLKVYIITRTGSNYDTNPITRNQYEKELHKNLINFSPDKTVPDLMELLKFSNCITSDTKHFFLSSGFSKPFYMFNPNNNYSKIKALVPQEVSEIILLCY